MARQPSVLFHSFYKQNVFDVWKNVYEVENILDNDLDTLMSELKAKKGKWSIQQFEDFKGRWSIGLKITNQQPKWH